MKKVFIAICLMLMTAAIHAQQLTQVCFAGGSNFSYYSFSAAQDLLIRISDDGTLLEYGTEISSIRNNNYYAPKLQPYLGRIEYFGPEADSAFRGKVRSIGFITFAWYGHYEMASKVGKLRSIGNLQLDYYDEFGDKTLKDKLKRIGNLAITYYSSFENEAFRGKIKSIGNTGISYFSSFDDRDLRGKIKTIGQVNYDWYTSFDLNRSGLKSGNYRRTINGITYVLW